jgi:hypothetical protein
MITDVIIDREKYLVAGIFIILWLATKKGHVAVFSMLHESRLGHLFTDF